MVLHIDRTSLLHSADIPWVTCRPQRKLLHAALHTLAVIAVVLALIAAFTSHTLKRPVPTPNLYSPHSYLGITTMVLLGSQVLSFTSLISICSAVMLWQLCSSVGTNLFQCTMGAQVGVAGL